jgi:hypothetical protein
MIVCLLNAEVLLTKVCIRTGESLLWVEGCRGRFGKRTRRRWRFLLTDVIKQLQDIGGTGGRCSI